uniref:Aminotransferase-like plant mobile domain-containing protein n=1 Tax=Ananas comosus var. bracteatus TaxID=296719 RepID=A0A6V7QA20_ANACO|nr:unnamed protein product [Ananas comosus var. bracteatus]
MIIRAGMALKHLEIGPTWMVLKTGLNDVIAQYKTQLVQAEILGAIIAFKGKYDKNPKLFKGLVELWCSETNTFHLPYGEVGISLWDIKELGGLSIIGEMYDEFVPSNSELKNYRVIFVNYSVCMSGLLIEDQMAHGTRFALAPAVLCSIQAALGHMVSDRRGPAYPYCRFPIDFLFAWVGARFEKVYTRRPIREDIKSEGWVHEVIDMRGRSDFPEEVQEWIISLRHSVLPLRLGVSHTDEELSLLDPEKLPSPTPEELPSPTPKGIVEELPLPTLKGFTLPIPRDTVGELPSPAPIEVEQILPSHYDDEVDYEPSPSPPACTSPSSKEGDVDQETTVGHAVVQEEVAVTTVEESTSLVEKISEKIALDLDPTITEYVGSTLIGQVIDMIKTSSYRDYKTVQERVRSHCRSLSSFGINISNLEMRLQRLFDGAAAIEKVMSLPTFASSARLVTAEENLDLLEKELETCLSSQNSLRQNLEQYSSEFARQENEMAELEKVLADKRAANAELSNRINMAKNCLQELDLTQEKIEGKSAEAERELIEAKEGYIATMELATLRDLISNFENYRKNI